MLGAGGNDSVGHWLIADLLWEIGASVAFGLLAGWVAGRLFRWARQRPFTDATSTLTVGIALALAVLAAGGLVNADGILAVFVAGLVFNDSLPEGEKRHERIQEAFSRFFDLPVFILFGMMLPVDDWLHLGGGAITFAIAVMFVRRLPIWMLCGRYLASLKSWKEQPVAGWFGPIGISSVYYALLAGRRQRDRHDLAYRQPCCDRLDHPAWDDCDASRSRVRPARTRMASRRAAPSTRPSRR